MSESDSVRVPRLGDPGYASPLRLSTTWGDDIVNFTPEHALVRHRIELNTPDPGPDLRFEKAGPRQRLFFDPPRVRAAIVTCGGLCPGLNNVIRSAFLEMHFNYGVPEVLGLRYGYQGLNPTLAEAPLRLTPELVEHIHEHGGTILGTSRGEQDPRVMADFLQRERIDILLCIGGDGTQRGAVRIADEARRRGAPVAVVGIPKTIDNDIAFVSQTFGFATAVEKAREVLYGAHAEAKSAFNGIGLVKVMGRHAGFIACGATVASQEVNFTLIPEAPLVLEGERGFLPVLHRRLLARHHAVIVVAEGAGQELFAGDDRGTDASGNARFGDIGVRLKSEIERFFKANGTPVSVKYFDPSYYVRSVPANSVDSLLCDHLARHAVHAAMSGRTGILVGHWNDVFIHVPIGMAVAQPRRVSLEGDIWRQVLSATGQPASWRS
jgi:6-phosphofructokinase 1